MASAGKLVCSLFAVARTVVLLSLLAAKLMHFWSAAVG